MAEIANVLIQAVTPLSGKLLVVLVFLAVGASIAWWKYAPRAMTRALNLDSRQRRDWQWLGIAIILAVTCAAGGFLSRMVWEAETAASPSSTGNTHAARRLTDEQKIELVRALEDTGEGTVQIFYCGQCGRYANDFRDVFEHARWELGYVGIPDAQGWRLPDDGQIVVRAPRGIFEPFSRALNRLGILHHVESYDGAPAPPSLAIKIGDPLD